MSQSCSQIRNLISPHFILFILHHCTRFGSPKSILNSLIHKLSASLYTHTHIYIIYIIYDLTLVVICWMPSVT